MNILYLGPVRPTMTAIVAATGDTVSQTEDKPAQATTLFDAADFLISFGYRHIIGEHILRQFPQRAINLHIAMLPWNRGADPNLWSFLEDTPKGVTIHQLDPGVDTGAVLAQEAVAAEAGDTLRSSYERLIERIARLFARTWPAIREGRIAPRPQVGAGTTHRLRDKEAFLSLLTAGWDTPVDGLIGKASNGASHA